MPPKPPKPSIRPFAVDEMSTSRGRRFALQEATLGVPRPSVPPAPPSSPLLQALDSLTAAGARAELSKFLVARSPDLEATVKQADPNAARALLRAWEQVALDERHSELVLAWVGRLGKDRELLKHLAAGCEPGKPEAVQQRAVHERVMSSVVAPAVRLLMVGLEARFAGQRTGNAKIAGALARVFRDFDSKSAFAAVAKLKPDPKRK